MNKGGRVGGIVDGDGLGDGDGVAAVIGDGVYAGDDGRAGSCRGIADPGDDRVGGAVVGLVGDDRNIGCRDIGDALNDDRSRVGGGRVGGIVDGDGLGDGDGVAAVIGDGVYAGDDGRAGSCRGVADPGEE